MMTPTQRSLKHLRDLGYCAWVAERWNPFARVRVDAWGFADILAVRADQPGVLAVQTTSGANVAARVAKIRANAAATVWVLARNRLIVHGWARRGPRGQRKVWTLREEVLS